MCVKLIKMNLIHYNFCHIKQSLAIRTSTISISDATENIWSKWQKHKKKGFRFGLQGQSLTETVYSDAFCQSLHNVNALQCGCTSSSKMIEQCVKFVRLKY